MARLHGLMAQGGLFFDKILSIKRKAMQQNFLSDCSLIRSLFLQFYPQGDTIQP